MLKVSKETDIIKDMRALILADVSGVAVFDRWAQTTDGSPYITFGPTQVVRNHAKGSRFKNYFVSLHLWVRDAAGSIATRDLAGEVTEALDLQKLETAELDCYFTDHITIFDEDEVTNHIVLNFEVR